MKLYFIIFALFIAIAGCKSEARNDAQVAKASEVSKPVKVDTLQQHSTETALVEINEKLKSFSSALEQKDRIAFISLSDTQDVYLVRIFTSGNLGGRGEPLSQITNSNQISNEMDFAIGGQTAFSVPSIFASLPMNSFQSVLRKPLLLISTQTPYDQWASILMQSLKSVPEVKDGAPVILVNESLGYWVFADAQIIDDILVGGFAVFKSENGTSTLEAMIELL